LESKFPIKVEFYQTLDNLTRKGIEVWKWECGKENTAPASLQLVALVFSYK
jgi:hypothetical protein